MTASPPKVVFHARPLEPLIVDVITAGHDIAFQMIEQAIGRICSGGNQRLVIRRDMLGTMYSWSPDRSGRRPAPPAATARGPETAVPGSQTEADRPSADLAVSSSNTCSGGAAIGPGGPLVAGADGGGKRGPLAAGGTAMSVARATRAKGSMGGGSAAHWARTGLTDKHRIVVRSSAISTANLPDAFRDPGNFGRIGRPNAMLVLGCFSVKRAGLEGGSLGLRRSKEGSYRRTRIEGY